jgi:nucleoside phosphorylase
MTAILFSTEQEAAPFLENYERGRFDGLTEGESLSDDRLLVSLVGSGKIKATLRTERFIVANKPSRIVLAGTCTALREDFEIGQVVAASQVFEGDRIEMAAPTYPRMPLETPFEGISTATLVTQDHLPQSGEERSYWQRIADMTDMVGYPVAFVAATHGIPCHIVKVVAGHTSKSDDNLQKTLARANKSMATFLLEKLD